MESFMIVLAVFSMFSAITASKMSLAAETPGTAQASAGCGSALSKPEPYLELEAFLKSHESISAINPIELKAKIQGFHESSLRWNLANRSGMSRRVIYLISTNAKKLPEYQNVFHRYGIEVLL